MGSLGKGIIIFLVLAVFAGLRAEALIPEHVTVLADRIDGFVEKMVTEHDFDRDDLETLFSTTAFNPRVMELMNRPYEKKPWYVYRDIFLNRGRIVRGAHFYRENRADLLAAQKRFGVAPELIVSIIGVESHYGTYRSGFTALESLATLAFADYRRNDFFMRELEHFLLYARSYRLPARTIPSSYAGAIGIPQFMPSNIEAYGVDFDEDGVIDLIHSRSDAIGSVANFLASHGWKLNEPTALRVRVKGDAWERLVTRRGTPKFTVAEMIDHDIAFPAYVRPERKGSIVVVDGQYGSEYWAVFGNFHAITRYNPSVNYAMAVFMLAEEIRKSSG